MQHVPHIALDAVVLSWVLLVQIRDEKEVVPHVVLMIHVLVKVIRTAQVVEGAPLVAAHETVVFELHQSVLAPITQRGEGVDDQTNVDVEEQNADPDEKDEVENHTRHEEAVHAIGRVDDVPHDAPDKSFGIRTRYI